MAEAVLLVAHGSRSLAGRGEMLALAGAVASARPGTPVRAGFLEMSDPPASTVLEELLADGARDITVVPLMLFAAGHSKSDVPAVVLQARARHPGARIAYGRPLGVDHALLTLARRRLRDAGAAGMPLAVLARGTSDPDANAEAWRASRLLADMAETQLVATGFSGLTWPTVTGALEQLRVQGAERMAVFSWFLATGVLLDRMRADWEAFASATGLTVVDAGYFGIEPELVHLVWERVGEADAGRVEPNCDACSYRRPFPGLADRVGMAVGVGHSHLAAEHRGDDAHVGRGHGLGHDPEHGHEHGHGIEGSGTAVDAKHDHGIGQVAPERRGDRA